LSGNGKCMIPNKSGTYALVLRFDVSSTVEVGRLGSFRFPVGWYIYIGSAHGPGGLASRIGRHLRSSKLKHWHIDYLCPQSHTVEIWYTLGTQIQECVWSRALAGVPGVRVPAPRFGASDCQCPAHLFHFVTHPQPTLLTGTEDTPAVQRASSTCSIQRAMHLSRTTPCIKQSPPS